MSAGGTNPQRIILGTMRWGEVERSTAQWAAFLAEAHALGIAALHSSSEYDSFPQFCAAIHALRAAHPAIHFRHIVKLADPHFGEAGLDTARLERRIDSYRAALGVARIDDVQWMWRASLDDDAARIATFRACADALGEARHRLQQAGKITRLLCFPYSCAFGHAAVQSGAIDGLVVYRNRTERADDSAISAAAARGLPTIVIRPFHGGAALSDGDAASVHLRDALAIEGAEAAVLSSNHLDHLRAVIAA